MKCANCGKEIKEADAFCPYCGEKLTGFGTSGPDLSSDREETDMTFIGSYDDQEDTGINKENRTFIDSFRDRGKRMEGVEDLTQMDPRGGGSGFSRSEDGMTYVDSSVFSDNNASSSSDRNSAYPGMYGNGRGMSGDMRQGGPYDGAYGYKQPRGSHPASGYAPPSQGYSQTASTVQKEKSFSGIVIILAVLLILLAAAAAAFFFFRDRTPELDSMTYDELVTEYGLSSDDSDAVRSAYYDNVRIEFEDVSEKKTGYKATAVIYAPDMEEIYEKSTEESSVVDRLERISDDDLHKTRKSVKIEENSEELTQNSAEDLKEEIDRKYMTVDEYNAEHPAGTSDPPDSSGSGSGSTSSGSGQAPDSSGDSSSGGGTVIVTPPPSSSKSTNSGYMIPDSSTRYISSSELTGFSAWECRVARNEIYARHGRRFKDSSLQSYFNNCTWYSGTIAPDSFSESVLNACEKANVQTIKQYELAHGYLP